MVFILSKHKKCPTNLKLDDLKLKSAKTRCRKLYDNFISKNFCIIEDDESYIKYDHQQTLGAIYYIAKCRGKVHKKIICKFLEILKNELSSDLDDQLVILQSQLCLRRKICFQFSTGDKKKLKNVLTKIKIKWKSSNRTKKIFLKTHDTWLKASTNICIVQARNKEKKSHSAMGRPPLNFDEASERTKRQKTEEMRSTFSSSELAFASQMSLRASGSCNAGVTVKDLPSTIQHRVANYIESLKLSQISQTSELCAETALSILMEAKLSKHQYCIIRSAAIASSTSVVPDM
nr:uncharacterized protein LOC124814082 [Hydra vulgaris]